MVTSIHVFGTTLVVGLNFLAILLDATIVTIATISVELILSPYSVIYSKSCRVFDVDSEAWLIGIQRVITASLYSIGDDSLVHTSFNVISFLSTFLWYDEMRRLIYLRRNRYTEA